jgi:hypothetical protein
MVSVEEWRDWNEKFVEVDKACDAFLRDRTDWSLVKYRWDNPDRLLSGHVREGVWGNIHILLPEASIFRFSYAIWRSAKRQVQAKSSADAATKNVETSRSR